MLLRSRESATQIKPYWTDAYADFLPCKISWSEFCEHWIPGLTRDGIRVGVNWSGTRATGYDVEPEDVKAAVEAQRR